MARAASLPTLGLTPFGGSGSGFDAFSISAKKSERAYLALRKVEVEWEAGRVSNEAYLAALRTYSATLKANTSERVGADARIEQYSYRFERNALVAQVEAGTKTYDDLLAYDQSKLSGLEVNSEEYQQRLGYVNSDQNRIFNDLEKEKAEQWEDGRLTTAQLMLWYQSIRPDLVANNKELSDAIAERYDDLEDRALNERDNKMMSDFSSGKITPTEFLAYSSSAQNRYEPGTTQYNEWADRTQDAKDRAIEDSILYRYDLTQRYYQLEKFVKDHGEAPKGSKGGTSTSKRVVWDGTKWVTKTTTTRTGGSGPTPNEVKAWKELQIEVKSAKAEMAAIASKVGKQAGGWVTTDDMLGYYTRIQSRFAVGTSEWYAVQGKIDGLNQQKNAEAVLRKQGIKISYPKVGSEQKEYGTGGTGVWGTTAQPGSLAGGGVGPAAAPTAAKKANSNDRDLTVDEFMRAIAKVESGGRYDARNKTSGAYGKYQIMPSNWPAWAQKFLGDRNAKPTPENQEKVARGKFTALYKWLGDWRAVAHWWLTGGSDKAGHRDPSQWSASSTRYVNKVFGKLGMSPTEVRSAPISRSTGGGGGGVVATGGGGTGGGTTVASGGKAPAKGKGKAGVEPDDYLVDRLPGRIGTAQNPLNFPKGYDGRAYENFYDAYMDAWRSDAETFTVFSSGKPVTYFIPNDPETRVALADELDDRRVEYYIQKAKAYVNKDGSPSSSSIYALEQADNAIKTAVENQLYGLSFENATPKPGPTVKRTGALEREDRPAAPTVEEKVGKAASAVNPLAAGIRLSEQLDRQLEMYAGAVEKAYKNGDYELAYGLNQQASRLVDQALPVLSTYLESAKAAVKGAKSVGADIPTIVKSDLEDLTGQIEEITGGTVARPSKKTDDSLKRMDAVQGEIDKLIRYGQDGEPIINYGRDPMDRTFQLQEGVRLIWKNGELVVDRAAAPTGWTSPNDKATGKPMVKMMGVRIGSKVKGDVYTEYESGVVGFVGGNENYPVYGKIVSGVDANGKQFMWAEDPIRGGWYSIANRPLNIKVPNGFKGIMSATGADRKTATTPMDYEFKSGNDQFRLVWDKADAKYAIWSAPVGLSGEWAPVGKVGGGKNEDLLKVLDDAGWNVDLSGYRGDDRLFAGTLGPVIGLNGDEYRKWMTPTKATTAGVSSSQARGQAAMAAKLKRSGPLIGTSGIVREGADAARRTAVWKASLGAATGSTKSEWNEADRWAGTMDPQEGPRTDIAKQPWETSVTGLGPTPASWAPTGAPAKGGAILPKAKPTTGNKTTPSKVTPSKPRGGMPARRRRVAAPPKPKPAPKPTYAAAKQKILREV